MNEVTFLRPSARYVGEWLPAPPKMRFMPPGPPWFRRLAERALRRALRWAGAEVEEQHRVFEMQAPDGETLLKRVGITARDCERVYGKEVRYLLVGPESLNEVKREVALASGPLIYATEARFGQMRNGRSEMRVLGLDVVYIPWMTGAVLVPELTR